MIRRWLAHPHPRPPMHRALLLLALALAAGTPLSAQAPPNPCTDSLYLALRERPLRELTDREYEYFSQRERACVEYQTLRSLVDRPAPAERAEPISSETRTAANHQGGVDVYVTNTSRAPIVVSSLRVYDCRNLRSGSCGLHHPKVRLNPGQERRVLTIRFQAPEMPTEYRYQYWVSAAPKR